MLFEFFFLNSLFYNLIMMKNTAKQQEMTSSFGLDFPLNYSMILSLLRLCGEKLTGIMLMTAQDVLSPSQLKRLSEHKYCCTSSSLLDPLMQPFWNWLVDKVPLWLAPNLITVTGLWVNIVTSLIVVFYSPDARQQAPCWTFLLCALGIFIYQSLDAIDGKQARRTGSSSPLGELFDHGCDSISTVFVAISVCVAVQLGTFPAWMFFQCFAAIALFYCAHWQTYVSGTLRFGKIDVTEVQFSVIGLHLISATFGPSVWATEIPILSVELKLIPVIMALTVTAILFHASFSVILSGGVGKNGSTVAGTSVLSPCIPFGMVVLPAFIIYQKSINNLYEDHPCLYIIAFGLVAAKVTNRLVIAHMTKSEMDYFDSVLVGPAMLFLNQYFNTAINEHVVLWLCLIWSTLDLLRYCTRVCNQICRHLAIHLFKITPKIPLSVTSGKTEEGPPSYLQAMTNNENEERNSSDDEHSFSDHPSANQERQPFLP